MLLKLIWLISGLVGLGLWLLTDALWVLPVAFAGCFLLSLLCCFLVVLYEVKRSDPTAEYTADDPFIRGIVKLYAPAVFRLLGCRIRTEGIEKLPRDGRFLLVSNHISDLDPGIPLAVLPDAQLAFIAKKEVLDMPILGQLMPRLLCQFIDRENDRAALKTILRCIAILKADQANIAVFPEGGIIKDGKLLHNFRPGVFKIAQKADVPIVVCTLRGTREILKNVKKLRRTDVHFHLLEVIPAGELKGVTTTQIAERVHGIMAADLGAENVAG